MKRKKSGKAGEQKLVKIELQSLKKKVGKTKRQIAALKTKALTGGLRVPDKEDEGDEDDSDGSDDAGDCFGGKRQKKPKTEKK